ncbi:MATE family efflux transporter [Brotaphodocola sp.]|uniref:MATE family efflux transporter n=1 Tax=Brotaphodocola sp. TaxID=3073577 RepID=UPI003D7CE0C1
MAEMDDSKKEMFTNKDLRKLIIPLFVEQFLLMFVGIADTFVVSFSSEADVSGVSLVTSFNTVLIFLFTALSSGGAVIISQYIGSRDEKTASESASQLLLVSVLISVILSALILIFRAPLLKVLFGKIEPDVRSACESYLVITTFSLPALAIYDAGAALCRSIKRTNATMYISAITNVLNIIGNCIGVFGFHLGAAGVAYPSLITRILSACAITMYCFHLNLPVKYKFPAILRWDGSLQKKIMGIALPNGIENGVHQLVKVALSSMVALFGTYQIAANGMAQSIWSLASIMGLAMAPVYTTVIGQCMGARNIEAANKYFKKLNRITLILSVFWNTFVFVITPLIIRYSAISDKTKSLVIWLVLINNIFNALAYPFAGSLGNGLRAAGDVKFTMLVSISLTIFARLLFSALFGLVFGWGVIGIALGMSIDLVFRGIIFIQRYRSQKWTRFHLI